MFPINLYNKTQTDLSVLSKLYDSKILLWEILIMIITIIRDFIKRPLSAATISAYCPWLALSYRNYIDFFNIVLLWGENLRSSNL